MQRKWKRRWQRTIKTSVLTPLLAVGLLLSAYSPVLANPSGATVTSGSAVITQDGNKMTIATSDKVVLNWQNYNIAKGESVQYVQPSANSVALNRVLGNNASTIYGNLSANGKVFLVNPNGVLFAPGSQVNVGGLVASTRNISNGDFLDNKYTFNGTSNAAVLNQGTITASDGGYVALLGAQAKNEGVIVANQGTIALGSGNAVTLDLAGDGFLNLAVNQSTLQANVDNKGMIQADGGRVYMSARTADTLASTVVNNSGTIQARSIHNKNGVIVLDGGNSGTVINAGTLDVSGKDSAQSGGTIKELGDHVILTSTATLDASGAKCGGTVLVGGNRHGEGVEQNATTTTVGQGAKINADAITSGKGGNVVVWANDKTDFAGNITAKGGIVSGNGGSVETSGKKTLVFQGNVTTTAAHGKTGTLLLDPEDYTIGTGATGSNYLNNSDLATQLGSNQVTVTTVATGTGNGDILVTAPITWSSGNTLALSAYRNININANITATGSNATLSLQTGTGGSGSYKLGNGNAITLAGAGAGFSLNGINYTVINDYSAGGALQALQNSKDNLTGNYFLGVNIAADATQNWNANGSGGYSGFVPIGSYSDAFNPISNPSTAFAGVFDGAGHTISNLYINRPTTNYVGLFGYIASGATVENIGLVGTSSSISGARAVGGLAGANYGLITNSYTADGNVLQPSGSYGTGGLVGRNSGIIQYSYNSDTVTAGSSGGITASTGGLVGWNNGQINYSYNNGVVKGKNFVGGLVGSNNGSGSINYDYNTGAVSGTQWVGGLVGVNVDNGGRISFSYSTGAVTIVPTGAVGGPPAVVGGFIGANSYDIISNSYWDVDASQQNNGVGAGVANGITGLRSSTGGTGTAFNQGSYVGFNFADPNPTWFMIDGSTRPFLASEYSRNITNDHQLQLMVMNPTATYTLRNNIDMSELRASNGMWRTAATTDANGNYGFVPVGSTLAPSSGFTGTFDGLGHTISDLIIHKNNMDDVGLFGYSSGTIRNVGLLNVDVFVSNYSGYNTGGWYDGVGALVGYNDGGSVTNSYSTGAVTLSQCASDSAGGLVGHNSGGTIANSYSNCTVINNGTSGLAGGLVGFNGVKTGITKISSIDNSYSTGAVTGSMAGGLVGVNNNYGRISNSYSTGMVSGSVSGGLLAKALGVSASITNSYWDKETSRKNTSGAGTGLTTAQMKKAPVGASDPFYSWDPIIWRFYDGNTCPLLRSFLTPLTVTVNNDSVTYNGNAYVATTSYPNGTTMGLVNGSLNYKNTSTGSTGSAVNVGNYQVGGLYSSQQGYDITYVGGGLAITPASLTITADNATKTYGQTLNLNGFSVTGLQNGERIGAVTLMSAGSDAAANAMSSPYAITASNAVGASGSAFNTNNYAINYVDGGLLVNRAALTITADNATKTYGQTLNLNGFSVNGLQNGERIGAVTLMSAGSDAVANAMSSPYAITASNAVGVSGSAFDTNNYAINYVDGGLIVNRAALTIAADNASKTYGQTLNLNGFSVTGLQNGERIGAVTLMSIGNDVTANVTSSPYAITASNAVGASGSAFNTNNYAINYVDGGLTVNRAALTIAATNVIKDYGKEIKLDGFSANGLQNGERIGAVTLVSAGSDATANVMNSPYTIIASDARGGTFNAGNYAISYISGALTVKPSQDVPSVENPRIEAPYVGALTTSQQARTEQRTTMGALLPTSSSISGDAWNLLVIDGGIRTKDQVHK